MSDPLLMEETGWLIERNDLGAPQWLHFGPSYGDTTFSPDASKALRFARKCDAETFIRMHEGCDPALRATDHMWMKTPTGDSDAKRAERVLQVFARYQRELMKGGNASSPGRDETLMIAASLTVAHLSAGATP